MIEIGFVVHRGNRNGVIEPRIGGKEAGIDQLDTTENVICCGRNSRDRAAMLSKIRRLHIEEKHRLINTVK